MSVSRETLPRVFGVDYKFLACGQVFTDGLVHAAKDLGLDYQHADWQASDMPAKIARFNPDLVFVVHGRRFAQWWGNRTAHRSAVWLLDEPYEVDDTSRWSSRYDAQFINDPATLARHDHATYLPVCYDPHVHQPGTARRCHPLGFIGGGNATRDRYLAALAQRGLLSYVIGGPWIHPAVQRLCVSRNIPADETPWWYQQTAIVLNVFREKHHFNRQKVPATALNPRIYEALACGALVVSEWRPELDTLIPELPTFRTTDECVEVVRQLQAEPERAETIRQACAQRIAPHTYSARLAAVLATMGLGVEVSV
jgi:spore maturation protein CgeB